MNSLLLAIFLMLIAICFFLERQVKSLTALMWPLVVIYIWMPLFLESVGLLNNFNSNEISLPIQVSVIFTALYALSFFCFSALFVAPGGARPATPETTPFAILSLALIGSILAILAYFGVGSQEILQSRWIDKSKLGIFSVIISWILAILAGQMILCVKYRKIALGLLILSTFIILAA